MIDRRVVLLLCGCVAFAGIDAAELSARAPAAPAMPQLAGRAAPLRPMPAAAPAASGKLVEQTLARPLFSPTRRPPPKSGPAITDLNENRLTGIVIAPDRRLAIFAVPGPKSVALSEGESVNGWRIDSITPQEVSLSGPAGTRTMQPKLDPNRPGPAALPPPSNPPRAAAIPAQPPRPRRGHDG